MDIVLCMDFRILWKSQHQLLTVPISMASQILSQNLSNRGSINIWFRFVYFCTIFFQTRSPDHHAQLKIQTYKYAHITTFTQGPTILLKHSSRIFFFFFWKSWWVSLRFPIFFIHLLQRTIVDEVGLISDQFYLSYDTRNSNNQF